MITRLVDIFRSSRSSAKMEAEETGDPEGTPVPEVAPDFIARVAEVIETENLPKPSDTMESLELLLQLYRGYKSAYIVTATQSNERLERLESLAKQNKEREKRRSPLPLVPNRRVAVIHIPKTAGTSLYYELKHHFPDSLWLDIGSDPMIRAGAHELENFHVIFGHMYMNQMLSKKIDMFRVAFFRNPIEFAVSYWRFLRSFGENESLCNRPDIRAACQYDFPEYVRTSDPNAFNAYANKQAALLIGEQHRQQTLDLKIEKLIRYRLDRLDFVGLTENFEQHLHELLTMLGANVKSQHVWLNRSSPAGHTPVEIADDLLEVLLEKSSLDKALYEMVIRKRQAL